MKKIIIAFLALFAALCLFSCTSEGGAEEETTAKSDWRNTIEYESSFFVNESKKMLYALDKGSITLWDNAGDGKALQVIEYDTSVADAIERIEKEDFNNDGNSDIRIIYSESEKGKRYNLFLWSEKAGRFVECQLYNTITDPVWDSETGNIVGVVDKGVFGTVTTNYAFNESSGLDVVSVAVGDLEGVASLVCASVGGDRIERIVNSFAVNDIPCNGFYVYSSDKRIAYIAYTAEYSWFVDEGCCGLYREVGEKDNAVVLGDYVGAAKHAYDLVKLIKGEGAKLTGMTLGVIRDLPAERFGGVDEEGNRFAVVTDDKGLWYYSEDGTTFVQVLSGTGEIAGEEEYQFAVPTE